MGEHHCRVCTSVSGGVRLDLMHHGPQVTSFLRVCQHLWLGSSLVPGLKPDVRQRLPFPQWLSLSYCGQGGIPNFWSNALNVRPDLAVLPQLCVLPSPNTTTLPQRDKRSMFWLEKLQKEETYRLAGYRDPGYLQCAICAITISSVPCPA